MKTQGMQLAKKTKPIITNIIGVDEAGRGSWAGPVVAGCVSWSGQCPIRSRLGDSKKLSHREREEAYEEIVGLAHAGKLQYSLGIVPSDMIDEVGIREANRRAMQEALQKMYNVQCIMNNCGIRLLIDGRDNYAFDIPDLPQPEYIVRGDSKIKQIMAASIVAKVTRDRLMMEYAGGYPGYGFEQHKGYGTALHQKTLQKLGVCGIHRKSYRPIKKLVPLR